MEEKNEWIYNYVNNLSNNINSKYGFFVIDNNIANSIIKLYTNSDEDIEQIKQEIDKIIDELIEKNINDNKEKIDNPTTLIEKLGQLNPGV